MVEPDDGRQRHRGRPVACPPVHHRWGPVRPADSLPHPRSTGARENGSGARASTPGAEQLEPRRHRTRGWAGLHRGLGAQRRRRTEVRLARGRLRGSSGSRRWTGHLGQAYRRIRRRARRDVRRLDRPRRRHGRRRGDCHAAAGALASRTEPGRGCASSVRPKTAGSSSSRSAHRRSSSRRKTGPDPCVTRSLGWGRSSGRTTCLGPGSSSPRRYTLGAGRRGRCRRRGTVAAFDSDDGTRAWSTELRRVDAYGIYALHAPPGGDAVYAAGARRHGEVRHGARPRGRRSAVPRPTMAASIRTHDGSPSPYAGATST